MRDTSGRGPHQLCDNLRKPYSGIDALGPGDEMSCSHPFHVEKLPFLVLGAD